MTDPLEEEIEQTRERIAEGVDALTGKVEQGAKRSAQIAIPAAAGVAVLVVALVLWRRRG